MKGEIKITNIASKIGADTGYQVDNVIDIDGNGIMTVYLFRENPSAMCQTAIAVIDRLQKVEEELAIALDIIEREGSTRHPHLE